LKIATWNVNSLRVRLPHVLDWLKTAKPDILALQETKIPDEEFPIAEINQAGYQVIYNGQRTYNGVAILSRKPGSDIITDPKDIDDAQRRILGMTMDGVRIINLYVPNGESVDSEKYQYKLTWLKKITQFLKQELKAHRKLIVLGDFNITPEDQDVHNPKRWAGQVLCSEPERKALQEIIKLGLQDCFRLHKQPERSFSWWDYRLQSFQRDMGLRIDLILATPDLSCSQCYIDKVPRSLERPSDHTPVIAEFN